MARETQPLPTPRPTTIANQMSVNRESQARSWDSSESHSASISSSAQSTAISSPVATPRKPDVQVFQQADKWHRVEVSRSSGKVVERLVVARAYICSACQRSFSCSSNLKRHLSVHTGYKPYKCIYCPHAFSNSSNRRKHERTHIRNGSAAPLPGGITAIQVINAKPSSALRATASAAGTPRQPPGELVQGSVVQSPEDGTDIDEEDPEQLDDEDDEYGSDEQVACEDELTTQQLSPQYEHVVEAASTASKIVSPFDL